MNIILKSNDKHILYTFALKPHNLYIILFHNFDRFGGLYYCPNTNELSALPQFTEKDLYPVIPFWMSYKSTNPLLFYNHIQYLYTMTTDQYSCQNLINGKTELCNDPPSKRILHLMSRVFSRWHSTWLVIDIQIIYM